MTASPASVTFGNVVLGASQTQSIVLTNASASELTVMQASINNSAFALAGVTYPLTLAAGKSLTCIVTFAPKVGGTTSGTVSIVAYIKRRYRKPIYSTSTVPVSGSGVMAGQLVANPQSLVFGNVQVGSSQSLIGSVSNSGGSSLTISQVVVTGTGFSLPGLTLPMAIAPGQSAPFTIVFTPQASGSLSGSISITSNATNPNIAVGLAGTGVLAAGALSSTPSGLSFGNVQVGNSQALSVRLANTGGSSITISQANISNSSFNVSGLALPLTLNAGQSSSLNVLFAPKAAGNITGTLTVVSNASNTSFGISLVGTGVSPAVLTANPASLSFGNVGTGSSQTLSETLTNSGGSTLTISQIAPSGVGFALSGINPPVILNPGQNLTFSVSFAPISVGSSSGGLSIASNASNPAVSVALSGIGVTPGQLSVSPSSLTFGNVTVGNSASQSATLNASNAPITISSLWGNSSEFTVNGVSLPLTIAAGSSATFNVTFTPQASGTVSANLGFVSNASNSPTLQTLNGTGMAPVQHSVTLTWNASTSSNLMGYNIYRGGGSGGPYAKMNSAPNPGTSDTDATVQSGQTYYYVVTAVDSNGNESLFSNQVQAVIP